ncbi:heat shock protease protein [Salinarchaeum sp. Harcht-Bsk1]|nr:Hsp20/alpha crystallin family protein [Salinarchaeum sp. Harcht-Bsk1]AGN00983.1 heat shock protease protein [Salinarchaeum sp. Harcht-Bsk1]
MRPSTSWTRGIDLPNQLFETGSDDYELYEADDEFVLTVELPGFDLEDIAVSWDDGVLNVSAEHEDEQRGRQKTYHRRFRFPKRIVEEEIDAEYTNGVLEITLPVESGATARGTEIEVRG